jgi:hypothetical protein
MRLNKALLIKHVLVNKRIWKYSNGRNELCPPDIAHLRHKILENKIFSEMLALHIGLVEENENIVYDEILPENISLSESIFENFYRGI